MTKADREAKYEIIIEYMKRFPFYKWAAAYAGISADTLENWRKDDPEFAVRLEASKSEGIKYYGGKASPDLILKSADPETFKERVDFTSGDKPIPILGGLSNAILTNDSNKETSKTE